MTVPLTRKNADRVARAMCETLGEVVGVRSIAVLLSCDQAVTLAKCAYANMGLRVREAVALPEAWEAE